MDLNITYLITFFVFLNVYEKNLEKNSHEALI